MKYNKWVKSWLILGCVLLFFQIMIGGITRLTGSGLSITEWEVIKGTLPPMNETQWVDKFELYKVSPQYVKINDGMSMSDFKFIFFWEYFHRLWARLMGFVFLFPLIGFILLRWVDRKILVKLGYVFLFAGLAAVFGWIMVASGLVDRPWVNAYKLAIHLGIALATFGFLLWTTFYAFEVKRITGSKKYGSMTKWIFGLLCFQIMLGAIFSGSKAALVFPTWPLIGASFFPHPIFDITNWNVENFIAYDQNVFFSSLIHFSHRMLGYIVYLLGMIYSISLLINYQNNIIRIPSLLFITLLNTQVMLGILTLLKSKGVIPVILGSSHQMVAVCIFGVSLFLIFILQKDKVVN